TRDENLAMIRDTVEFLVAEGRRVFLDAEHFFDGYLLDRDYALAVVRTAYDAGADVVALCDTNGGMLPTRLAEVVHEVAGEGLRIGIHAHNDTACAVAELANIAPDPHQPWVGASAFAHKAGLHASALKVDPDLYQHTDPAVVGNDMRVLVSELAGRASVELKAKALSIDVDRETVGRVIERVKDMEARGYSFEAAEASFELLLREEVDGERPSFFALESYRVITETRDDGARGCLDVWLAAGIRAPR